MSVKRGVDFEALLRASARSRHAELCRHSNAEQVMGMPAERFRRRWTASDVRRLIAEAPLASPRYELVDGDLVVTPSPSFRHQEAVTLLLVALSSYCRAEGVGHAMASPSDIELEPESVRQPDVFVLPAAERRRLAREGFPARELLLAVEVVSPGSAHDDRVRKRALYQRRVPEYWVVDTDARVVERWRAGATQPEVLSDRMEWLPAGAHEPLILDLAALFGRVWAE